MKVEYERFDNAARFVSLMDTRPVNYHWARQKRSSRTDRGGDDWAGTSTWGEAVDKARSGYSEVVGRVQASAKTAKKNVFERVEARPVRPVNAYVGGSPNVIRAMLGIPRDMRTMQRRDKKTPGITLVYEVSANAGVSTSVMIEAGARMVALVRLFERAQIPVRLIVSDTGISDDDVIACEVVIKDFSAPFNIQKIAFYIAHPAMHRRLWFSWLETTPAAKRHYSCYMRPISNDRSDYENVREDYRARGIAWFCFKDFRDDDDVVRAWENITARGR